MPKISVIVPIYKVEKYLNKCIDSILSQTFKDFEIILVDDGSPDNCGAICDKYESENENIKVIHQQNGGLSFARNSGIDFVFANSNSEWIAFVDSDDYLKENYLEKLYNACIENDADLVVCDFERVDEKGNYCEKQHEFLSEVLTDKTEVFNRLYYDWRIHPAWNKLYKKEIFNNIRFDNGKLHEDEFIIHKVLFESKKTVFIDDSPYCYLTRTSGIMGTESIKTRNNGLEAEIERYYFCVKNKIITEDRLFTVEYMRNVLSFANKDLRKEYKKIYFGKKENKKIKRRIKFTFYSIIKRKE